MSIHKALVIDDSKVAHLALSKLLRARGIEVDWLGSGEEAVRYLQKQEPPDVVFMDILMPGMNGFEATRTIVNSPGIAAPPIIMCSGNTSEQDKRQADESGAFGFLSKPYTPDELDAILNAVSERLHQGAGRQPEAGAELAAGVGAVAERPDTEAIERTARAAAMETAQHVAAEVAGFTAEQTARAVAQEAGRAAVQAAEQAAREMAERVVEEAGRKVKAEALGAAVEVARTAATEAAHALARQVAQSVAVETARGVAQRVAREVSEGLVAQAVQRMEVQRIDSHGAERDLEAMREDLMKGLEERAARWVQEALAEQMAGEAFQRQLVRVAQEALGSIESVAREAATQAVRQASEQAALEAPRAASGPATDGEARKRANLALAAGVLAVLVSLAASVFL